MSDGSAQATDQFSGFTPEQQQCLRSRWWRLNNLYKIQDKNGRVVTFRPNRVQKKLLQRLWNKNIVPKSRQHGISTFAVIMALDFALWRQNTPCGIVTLKKDDAKKLFAKICFAYDRLPAWVRAARPTSQRDHSGVIKLKNGSEITCGVSLRGGTYYYLHISEYGPLCALHPAKAEEVKTGALNTVPVDSILTIESTAHGSHGDFYDKCQTAATLGRMIESGEQRITPLDYRLFFFGWFEDDANRIDPAGVPIAPRLTDYFNKLEKQLGITLRPDQRAWYAKKLDEQGDHMKREHPSTMEEAFTASVEGSYYGALLARAEEEGRICSLPLIPSIQVNTFWDLGRNDTTAIWFHQRVGPWNHFVDYFEDSGKGIADYAKDLIEIKERRRLIYGRHFLPHDAGNIDLSVTGNRTREQVLNDAGVTSTIIVDRIQDVLEGIDMVRRVLPTCRFDKTYCGEQKMGMVRGGIPALKAYTKEWNPKTEAFKDYPLHNWASNGADAFRQFAQGYVYAAERYDPQPGSDKLAKTSRYNPRARAGGSWKV